MMAHMDASTIIDALGGTGKVANLCGITPGSVSQWRNKGIPHPWAKFLRAARPKTFIRLEREAAARADEAERATDEAVRDALDRIFAAITVAPSDPHQQRSEADDA